MQATAPLHFEISVDIQIIEYRITFEQVCLRFLWNRNGIDRSTGVPVVTTGESYACLGRLDGFRIILLTGAVPFGRTACTCTR